MMRHLIRLADARNVPDITRENLELRFHETESRQDAGEKASELVRDLTSSDKPGKRLLILAGSDGFHNDVCTALLNAVPEIMSSVILYRLPMGTGNDNADAGSVEEAFARLGSAGTTRQDSLVSIQTARGARHYAFNVASFGLDAFVCELTNRMKVLAGPRIIYKIFADVAVLLYEWIWPLGNWDIRIRADTDGHPEIHRSGRFLLTVFGRKGDTRYGGGMKVLPGDENFLLVRPLSLLGKTRIKPLFYRGAHRGLPICEFYKTDEVSLTHHGRILMELDGEVVRLEQNDFPLRLVRVPDALTILK
jgi:diacylglycerol kinase family enzyme